MAPHEVWAAWNHPDAAQLADYMLDPTKMTDPIEVRRAVTNALPTLIFHRQTFRHRLVPHHFTKFYTAFAKVLDYVQSFPEVWTNFLPEDDPDAPDLDDLPPGFSIPTIAPPDLSALLQTNQSAPLPKRKIPSPALDSVEDASSALLPFTFGTHTPMSDNRLTPSSSAGNRPMSGSVARMPPSSFCGDRLNFCMAAERIQPSRKRKREDETPGREVKSLPTRSKVKNKQDKSRVDMDQSSQRLAPEKRDQVQGATTDEMSTPRSQNEYAIDPKQIEWDKVLEKTIDAFRRLIETDRYGEREQINLCLPTGANFFAAIVKKNPEEQYSFYSHLPAIEETVEGVPRFQALKPIPIEKVTELTFENGVLPDRACLRCNVERELCIPTALGASCHRCISTRYEHCDHRGFMWPLLEIHVQIVESLCEHNDVTLLYLAETRKSLETLSDSARVHYRAAANFDTHFHLFHRHTLQVIAAMGSDAFLARFRPTDDSPMVIDHLNKMVQQFNRLSLDALKDMEVLDPLSFLPATFSGGRGSLFQSNQVVMAQFKELVRQMKEPLQSNTKGETVER